LILFLIFGSVFQRAKSFSNEQAESIQNLSLSNTSTWCEFSLNYNASQPETSAWISLITFKSKQAVRLTKINLHWSENCGGGWNYCFNMQVYC